MTPEQRIQHDIMRLAAARGYEAVRLQLFQPGGSVVLGSDAARQLSGLRTGPASGVEWRPGTWMLHVPLPEASRGVPDLMMMHPKRPPLLIEVKTSTGRLSVEQRGWHARYGQCSWVCRSVVEAAAAIDEWERRYP